jgi:aminoglycoside phosphotransferase (APT) family kinase protein
MRERAERALRAHAPDLLDRDIVELGRGLDNVAYAAGDLVLRVGEDVVREARLLEVVAPRVSITIPRPRFADPDARVLAYERIPGRPLLNRPPPRDAARRLGRFLRELHAVEPVEDLVPTDPAGADEWLAELDGPPELVRVLHETRPKPATDLVLAHADLGAEHILELDGSLTGVIDWSDAAITDPALDFGRLYRDFGPAFLDQALEVYGRRLEISRIEFFARCAALEDLAYGRREYVIAAQRSIAWLFP